MSEQDVTRLLDRLAVAVWGQTGTNGIAGTQLKHGERITRLEEFKAELTVMWRVVRWMALAMAGLIGLLSTDTIARILADFIRALK